LAARQEELFSDLNAPAVLASSVALAASPLNISSRPLSAGSRRRFDSSAGLSFPPSGDLLIGIGTDGDRPETAGTFGFVNVRQVLLL